jgi:hypothetical protein
MCQHRLRDANAVLDFLLPIHISKPVTVGDWPPGSPGASHCRTPAPNIIPYSIGPFPLSYFVFSRPAAAILINSSVVTFLTASHFPGSLDRCVGDRAALSCACW